MKLAVRVAGPAKLRIVVASPGRASQERKEKPGAGAASTVVLRFGKSLRVPASTSTPSIRNDPEPLATRVISTAESMRSSESISS
jgi:hypothetical protein